MLVSPPPREFFCAFFPRLFFRGCFCSGFLLGVCSVFLLGDALAVFTVVLSFHSEICSLFARWCPRFCSLFARQCSRCLLADLLAVHSRRCSLFARQCARRCKRKSSFHVATLLISLPMPLPSSSRITQLFSSMQKRVFCVAIAAVLGLFEACRRSPTELRGTRRNKWPLRHHAPDGPDDQQLTMKAWDSADDAWLEADQTRGEDAGAAVALRCPEVP
jgi:hypothetical protein